MRINWYNQSKYRNEKQVSVLGGEFDSKKEMKKYEELVWLEKLGKVHSLQRQVKYVLIPAQYIEVNGKKKCIERECSYYLDFQYFDVDLNRMVYLDVKGFETDVFKIKRKLMLFVYGIKVETM